MVFLHNLFSTSSLINCLCRTRRCTQPLTAVEFRSISDNSIFHPKSHTDPQWSRLVCFTLGLKNGCVRSISKHK
ncbi:hypothetical protein [Rubritalea tangerina]|uniref:hypothetical protein n=1 Tax=Rubritalea tangerina TaxID=430798 RepID=UPI003607A4B5